MRPTGLLAQGFRKINQFKHFSSDVETDQLLNFKETEMCAALAPLFQLTTISAFRPVANSPRRTATLQ